MEFEGIPITLADGQERTLLFDLRAMRTFKTLTGKSLLGQFALGELTEEELAALVYCGLKRNHPELELEQIEDLITYFAIPMVMTRLAMALGAAAPQPEEGEDHPPATSRPTG